MARVLVSEVDPDVSRLLEALLERRGYEAVVLGNDVVVPPRADLLLVDPSTRPSIEHARLVRAFFPELPIVCTNPLPDDAGFLGRGPMTFLPKPFAPEQLDATLERIVTASPV
jgi:DNA-binding response OmpR family regulator